MDQKVQLLKPLNLRELYTTYQNRMKYIPVLEDLSKKAEKGTNFFLVWFCIKTAEVGTIDKIIDKSIIDNYRILKTLSNYRFTKIIVLSVSNH
jgi:hypothetical protein